MESLQEKIAAFEKILLRNLKLMRHRQVIHPVLQEGEYLLVSLHLDPLSFYKEDISLPVVVCPIHSNSFFM